MMHFLLALSILCGHIVYGDVSPAAVPGPVLGNEKCPYINNIIKGGSCSLIPGVPAKSGCIVGFTENECYNYYMTKCVGQWGHWGGFQCEGIRLWASKWSIIYGCTMTSKSCEAEYGGFERRLERTTTVDLVCEGVVKMVQEFDRNGAEITLEDIEEACASTPELFEGEDQETKAIRANQCSVYAGLAEACKVEPEVKEEALRLIRSESVEKQYEGCGLIVNFVNGALERKESEGVTFSDDGNFMEALECEAISDPKMCEFVGRRQGRCEWLGSACTMVNGGAAEDEAAGTELVTRRRLLYASTGLLSTFLGASSLVLAGICKNFEQLAL